MINVFSIEIFLKEPFGSFEMKKPRFSLLGQNQ
jgi:hypothetical protein